MEGLTSSEPKSPIQKKKRKNYLKTKAAAKMNPFG